MRGRPGRRLRIGVQVSCLFLPAGPELTVAFGNGSSLRGERASPQQRLDGPGVHGLAIRKPCPSRQHRGAVRRTAPAARSLGTVCSCSAWLSLMTTRPARCGHRCRRGHERAVDLQHVDREALRYPRDRSRCRSRPVLCAGRAASLARRAADSGVNVSAVGPLGQLEHERVRGQAAALQDATHVVDQAWIVHLARREVDAQLEAAESELPLPAATCRQAWSSTSGPIGRIRTVSSASGRNRRWDYAADRMLPPDEPSTRRFTVSSVRSVGSGPRALAGTAAAFSRPPLEAADGGRRACQLVKLVAARAAPLALYSPRRRS